MDREYAAGRRSHSRLIVSLLALALGAILGAVAPQALAGAEDSHRRYEATLYLERFYSSAKQNKSVKVTGIVLPVEVVGEFAGIVVQRKASNGTWAPVTTVWPQVLLKPPASWEGTFNLEVTHDDGNWSTWTSTWRGQVRYELSTPQPPPSYHCADYTMTWAQGEFTNNGIDTLMNGHPVAYAYTGFPIALGSPTPFTDEGLLRWYFAEDRIGTLTRDGGVVPRDSYEGTAWHNVSGTLFITGRFHPGEVEEVTGVSNHIDAEMWPGSRDELRRAARSVLSVPGEIARPLLNGDGIMLDSVVRPMEYMAGYTEKLNWNLTPSKAVTPRGYRGGDLSAP